MSYNPVLRSELLRKYQAYRISVSEGKTLLGYLRQDLERLQRENHPADAALMGDVMTSLAAYLSALRTTEAP